MKGCNSQSFQAVEAQHNPGNKDMTSCPMLTKLGSCKLAICLNASEFEASLNCSTTPLTSAHPLSYVFPYARGANNIQSTTTAPGGSALLNAFAALLSHLYQSSALAHHGSVQQTP
jgi:hypothetical protein